MNIFYFCLLLLIMRNEGKAQNSTDPETENIKRLFNETFNIIAAAKSPIAPPQKRTATTLLPNASSSTIVTPSMASPSTKTLTTLAATPKSPLPTTLTSKTSLASNTSSIPPTTTTSSSTTTTTTTTAEEESYDEVPPQRVPIATEHSQYSDIAHPPEPTEIEVDKISLTLMSYPRPPPRRPNYIPEISSSFTQNTDDYSYDDSTSEIKNKNYDYEVCGNVRKSPDCTCFNNTLTCSSENCYGWYCPRVESFKTANIKIMVENFVVKYAKFSSNELIVLKKGKVLPGNEGTVESLSFASKITTIEDGVFDNFTALQELDLSGNTLERISGKVFTKNLGSTLVKLNVKENQFTAISSIELSNLSKLKSLDLFGNFRLAQNELFSFYIFPESLSNLTYLNLARCGIIMFNDEAFKNLLSLETLFLYGNPIVTFPKSVLSMKNLRYLNLDETRITSLNYTDKNLNLKLEKLHLKKTSLKFINDCAFCNYPNLKDLQLYQNYNLSFIHENAFGFAYNGTSPPLESFSIEYCNLKTIPENLLDWNNVKAFGLGNNPFICNCSMAWLINDITSPTHTMNLQPLAPHPFRSYPPEVTEMETPPYDISMQSYPSEFELPYPTFNDPNLQENHLTDDGLKCFGPHALKHVKFIQISKNFCPNEAKREENSKLVVAESSKAYNWIHIGIAAVILIIGFFIGLSVFPLCRYFNRHKKQEYGFQKFNFPDDKASEDFDEEKK